MDWRDSDDYAGRMVVGRGSAASCGNGENGGSEVGPGLASLRALQGQTRAHSSTISSSTGGVGGSTRAERGNGGRAGRSRSTSKYGQAVACAERPGILAIGLAGVEDVSSSSSHTDEMGTTRALRGSGGRSGRSRLSARAMTELPSTASESWTVVVGALRAPSG